MTITTRLSELKVEVERVLKRKAQTLSIVGVGRDMAMQELLVLALGEALIST